jgi:pilus assembly protein Flp/PilA
MQYGNKSLWWKAKLLTAPIADMYLFRSLIETLRDDSGQNLAEYVLVAALISLAAVAGMSSLASAITSAYTTVGSHLSTYTS